MAISPRKSASVETPGNLHQLPSLLGRAYLRLLIVRAEKARNDAVSGQQDSAFQASNPLDAGRKPRPHVPGNDDSGSPDAA